MISSKTRISFSNQDAAHLYELALEHFCVSKKEGKCIICLRLKNRLETYLGNNKVVYIRKQISKYSYCKNLKNKYQETEIVNLL